MQISHACLERVKKYIKNASQRSILSRSALHSQTLTGGLCNLRRFSPGAARAIGAARALAGGEGRTWVRVNTTPARPRACPVCGASARPRGLSCGADTEEQCCSESWYGKTNGFLIALIRGVITARAARPAVQEDQWPWC